MKVEVIKQNGHFIIPYLEEIEFGKDKLEIEIDEHVLLGIKESYSEKSDTYKVLEKFVKTSNDDLLTMKLKSMSKNFEYETDNTDDDILYEALKEKYEL